MLDRVAALAPQWLATAAVGLREELATALDAASASLGGHLGEEEQLVLPLVEEHLSVAEWTAAGPGGIPTPRAARLPA